MASSYSPTYSIIQQPYAFNPINSPTWLVAYCTDNLVQNFEYIFNLYTYDRIYGTPSFIGQYNIPPRPNGQGWFDIHRILKSLLVTDFGFTMSTIMSSTSSMIPVTDNGCLTQFNVIYGYTEYLGLTFTSTGATGTGGSFSINLGTGITASYYFQPADVIVLQMAGTSPNQIYNGTQIIYGVTGTSININNPYSGTDDTGGNVGQIVSIQRALSMTNISYGLNSSRQYFDPNNSTFQNPSGLYDLYDNNNLFFVSATNSNMVNNFLTNWNLPDSGYYKTIYPLQYETVNVLSYTMSYYMTVNTYDNNLNLLNTYVLPTQTTGNNDYKLYTIGIGTANLQGLNGITLPSTGYYTVTLSATQSGTYSNTAIVRRQIINNCSAFNNVRIMFLNQFGGWDYWNFNYESKITTNITRTTFNRTLSYNYNIGDRGVSTLTTDAADQVLINTDILTDYEYSYLKELLYSPSVFVIDEIRMLKLPINITDSQWIQKSRNYRDNASVQLSLTYQYSYNISTQQN